MKLLKPDVGGLRFSCSKYYLVVDDSTGHSTQIVQVVVHNTPGSTLLTKLYNR